MQLRNDPAVVAEVASCFNAYERALRDGDLAAMASWFEDSPDLVRFGIADRQRGSRALAAWRSIQPPLPPGRTLVDTVITTFGNTFAVVSTLFLYPGVDVEGRQSQTWVREEVGWRIVHAHVSEVARSARPGG